MKKYLMLTLVIVFILSAAFAGCAQQQTDLVLATGGLSGTYYPFGDAMAKIFSTRIENINVTVRATGASVENLMLVGKKDVGLAIVQNDMADYAYNGTEAFGDEKTANVRAIATLYPEVIQIVASEGSNINTLSDIKGKKFSVGAPGSGVEANARQIFDVVGITFDDFYANHLSFSDSANSYKDKHIDGFLFVSGVPNIAIQDITVTNKLKFISIPDDIITRIIKRYPFYTEYVIPAGTYKGQTADVKTVAVNAMLITGAEVSEEVVYNLTKALFDNQPELASAHPKGQLLSLETAVQGITIPFHPGAEKFYKEKGAIK